MNENIDKENIIVNLEETNKNEKNQIYLFIFLLFLLALCFYYMISAKTNHYKTNLKTLDNSFTIISINELDKINMSFDYNKNLYILELYRFERETCVVEELDKTKYKVNDDRNKLNDHIVFFENKVYVNNILTKNLKNEVIKNINHCINVFNNNKNTSNQIKDSWKQKE